VYLVHVWHTTGEKLTGRDGVSRDVLEAQTSFGLYVEHDGALFGWKTALNAPGLQEIAPNFYKVAVPNNGTVRIRNELEALETPTDLGSILAWLCALLRALLRALIRWLLGILMAPWRMVKRLFWRIRHLFG
jgi:hypothetical protein